MGLHVPPRAFDKQTFDVNSISRRLCDFLVVDHLELHTQQIDCNLILSGIVLKDACEKGLREVEPANPVDLWDAIVDPVLKHQHPFVKVFEVAK